MALLDLLDVSHVALNVTDINVSTAFYKNVLGLKCLYEKDLPGEMGFSAGFATASGVMIELIQITGLEIDVKDPTSLIAFSVDNIEAAKAACREEGMSVYNELEMMDVKIFFIDDPDGYRIEICELPGGVSRGSQLYT